MSNAWGPPSQKAPPYLRQAREDAIRLGIPKDAYEAFAAQSRQARLRGIGWEFTLPEWWAWWQVDNRWGERGLKGDGLVMARRGDAGPYSQDNTYCTRHSGNTRDIPFSVKSAAQLASWATGRESHLVDRPNHPQNKAVETPLGWFPSATLAADAHGIEGWRGRRWAAAGKNGWRRAD